MPYTNVQFIGYVINTGPQEYYDDTAEYLGIEPSAQDVEARVDLMLRAMETARDNLPPLGSPPPAPGTTLKVFVAPEFFFRGSAGAYGMDDVQAVIAGLQRLASDDSWADWVFTFGTIVGVSSPTTPVPPYNIDPNAVKEIYNFTLIQEGGQAVQGPGGARIVMKELKSNIDFITSDANLGGLLWGQVEPMNPGASGPGREQQQVAYDGAGIFDMRQLTWAADICLDHIDGRLVRSPQLPGDNLVQIQLVPSGGAQITPTSVIAIPGGYVFNVDGNGYGATLQRVNVAPNPPTVIPPAIFNVPGDAITLTSTSPVRDVTVAELYPNGAGRIFIYPISDLPAAAKAPGTVTPLTWPASDDYQFTFKLVFDDKNQFLLPLIQPISRKTNFQDHDYYLPLDMSARDYQGLPVNIKAVLRSGTGGYDRAIWCDIDVPGFKFHGNVMRFDNDKNSVTQPETIW